MLVRYTYTVYHNADNNYCVVKYKDIENNRTVTCVGTDLPVIKTMTYDFEVEEFTTAKYGMSYKVLSYTEHIEKTKEDILAYLSCGIFKGITKKTAEKIYLQFGNDVLDILDNNIDKLTEVPGIGKKTMEKIRKSYIEKRASREIAEKLISYGVSGNTINRIYETFKADALRIIEEEPYTLCKIKGMTFPDVDAIAKDKGFKGNDFNRIAAASDYVLLKDMMFGNVCMQKLDYAHALLKVLNTPEITKENILSYVLLLMQKKVIIYNKRKKGDLVEEYFYYPTTFKAEQNIAQNVKMFLNKKKRSVSNIDALIDKYCVGITLDETQRNAVKMGVTEPIFIITGGPGTGKTTIIKIIAQINQELNKGKDNNIFLSPTGRAARRITESTGFPASTIHSALGLSIIDDESNIMEGNREEKIENRNVIVDETSMIDLWTMDGLMRNLSNSTLGLIGDVDQLPSVKCGSILRDLINCDAIPCIQLTHIHRQSVDALNICENADNIKRGIHELKEGKDFVIKKSETLEESEKILVKTAIEDIEKFGINNIKVLCPFKKNACGVYRVNNILQSIVNPLRSNEIRVNIPNDMAIHMNDLVMQLKNIDEVSNGDIGVVTGITTEEITVTFNGMDVVEYTYADAKEQLILAYATTVHKSQGSEYDSIIMSLTPQHGLMKKRNILYTGITRGKHKVTLIGTTKAFYDAIDNNMIEDRNSMLAELINPNHGNARKESSERNIFPDVQYEQMKLPFVSG